MTTDALNTMVINQLNTGVLVLDVDFNIVLWNRFLQVHTNKTDEVVLGQSVFEVFPELPRKWFERKLSGVVQLKTQAFCSWEQRHHLFELPHTRPITTASRFMAQNCTFSPVIDNGKVEQICILIEDVTDVCHYQTMLSKTLEDLALANRIDGLTQVFNRKHWEECLATEFSRARRYKHDLALIMLDLDHFKRLNDNYGHQCGDLVLIESAQVIQSALRSCDLFGRYGGEEFAVILPETNLAGAIDVAERIRSYIENHQVKFQGQSFSVTASLGVAVLTEDNSRYEDLISRSDISLYKAKNEGRNMVCAGAMLAEIA